MGDPFLNYCALDLLIFVIVVPFYGIIAIHELLTAGSRRRLEFLGSLAAVSGRIAPKEG